MFFEMLQLFFVRVSDDILLDGYFVLILTCISIPVGLLLCWRVWMFTILPAFKPQEPKEIPYWIPILGHALGFFYDFGGTLALGRRYFGTKTYKLTLGGQKLYIMTSPHDISRVYKNTEALTFDHFMRSMLLQLGASAGAVEKWIPSSGPKITSDVHGNSGDFGHLGEKLCRQQLLPGEELETLQAVLLDNIHVSTQWSKISDKIIQSFTQDTKTVSLLGWCREILLDAATRSFFDECLVKIDSHLYDSFFIFDELSWKLHFRYPRVLSKEMYAAKDRIIDALKIYFELPKSERKGESWLISNLETAMRDVGIETEDVAALIMPLYWVINANAYKSCFWTMAHILFDPGLLVTIRKEVDAVFAEGTANLEARLESCPMLEAVYLEALRLTSASGTIRNVRHTTELGDVTLQQGTNIVVPYRQLHYNETVFGPEPDQFHPERFLHNKELKRSPSFKPFGGGHTYCPGRFLARREVLSFVADLIHRFDLTLTSVGTGCAAKADTSGQRFPRMNTKKIALALIDPVFGDDLLVDVRERQI